MLEGRPTKKHAKPPSTLVTDLDLLIQETLDTETWIEEHNRRHPESPWADINDVLRELCGNCAAARGVRERQLQEEAQEPQPPRQPPPGVHPECGH